MKKSQFLVMLFAVIGTQHIATSQTRSFITGFETGSLAEGSSSGPGSSVQSAVVRSGSYAYRAHPSYSNTYIAFASRTAGGFLRQIFASSRFYLKVGQLPQGNAAIVKIGGAGTFNPEVDLNQDGTLTLADSTHPALGKSTKALSADGLWHRVEFDIGYGLRVYVDGVLWASGSTTTYGPGISILFGAGSSPTYANTTADLYFDDILIDSGSFANTGLPGDGHALLLRPAADPAVMNSWTGGKGSTWGLWMPVKNAPPAGLPASSETNMSQIKNGGRHGNLDYSPAVQSYASAGIPGTATINAVMAIDSDGQESAKSAKSGGIWIGNNPSQASGGNSFDYGDGNGVVGSFPSGWTSHYGPVTSSPGVSLGGSPTVVIRKTSTSGDVVDADALGVYVDYR